MLQWACWFVVDPKCHHGSEVILPAEEGFTGMGAEQGLLVWSRVPDPSASGQDWWRRGRLRGNVSCEWRMGHPHILPIDLIGLSTK